ncbi:MAG: bifunctional 3-(3-hydroxy-phenyl)propionate/3-hydroxycinnamic acid hydroxylase [Polaromonas sp.]|uniref:bifunctional 3-(3-hydroxy-phenyl)propionate/3-hydroxycinnamic acid hydroxylase MhpA n=1 Tax=Polaromonas sp. TaxID=1869339 RepID=UPI0025DB8064|nr:bifunctional 3-(3-hydroxy-phenyl)propionate/3-hydroxycinnamic acid hydroxylase [Polaromonas sp.]MBI2727536.1 bifunctional 3-(3-hydroxy-phenyl)propionate/3-hydroxycinnamic acid hydroxylase [Polaromonas sp.]
MPDTDSSPVFDVAIVGYGPTGATLANLLGSAGLSVLVIEKEADIFPLPRAIHFDGEVMRIFQSLGLKQEALAISRPGIQGMHFVNAANETLMIRGGTAALGPHGCANNYYFHQPELEALLRKGCQRFANVTVCLEHELLSVTQDGTLATLSVHKHSTHQAVTFQARYVVGCDGARSPVRKAMGSPLVDLGLRQPWLVFDVVLKRDVALPAHTVQICDPARPMTFCNVTGNRRRWEIMVMPGDDHEELVKPGSLWKLVSRWVTPADAQLERAAIYTFHSVIATGWRKGRLLLAGDACHQTPPFLGQGMCAGIRDAANLAWKLEAITQGRATDALLDSYEEERSPHVRSLIELAVKLGGIIQTTDPAEAKARDEKFAAGGPEIFELPAQSLGGSHFQNASHKAVGRPFPQPRLADGRWLDEVLGRRMTVMGRRDVIARVSTEVKRQWRDLDMQVLDTPDNAVNDWLQTHQVAAVIIRPDRYVLGVARNAQELEDLSRHLPAPHKLREEAAL